MQRPASMFRVCEGCGKLDRAARTNRPDEHRAWCRYRKTSDESTKTLGLMRTLRTQGVLLRLPRSVTIGDLFAVPSLSAALLLGLREQLGGTPDHLAVAQVADPTYEAGGGRTPEALLVHDTVPGGTGYLAELADPARLWDLLHRAYVVVRDCPCADEPRLACHRCLLPFAGGMHPVEHVSRQTAERHLRAILCSGRADVVPAGWEADGWTTTAVPPGADSTESHLEQHFRKVFRDRVTALGATVKEIPGASGNTLRLSFPGGTRVWTLEPQVLMAGSKPDFVLRCNDHNVPPVAIFTDGRQFHASPAHNRLADDATKRRALRDQGVVVLAVTAKDVEAAGPDVTPAPPLWFRGDVVESVLQSGQFAFGAQTVESLTGGPFAFLLGWLQKPDVAEHEHLAAVVPLFFAPRRPGAVPSGSLRAAAAALLIGDTTAGETLAIWQRLGQPRRPRPGRQDQARLATDIAVVLDDRDDALTEPATTTPGASGCGSATPSPCAPPDDGHGAQPAHRPPRARPRPAACSAAEGRRSLTLCPGSRAPPATADFRRRGANSSPTPPPRRPRCSRCSPATAGSPCRSSGTSPTPASPSTSRGPTSKVAVYLAPDPQDTADLQADGWQVLTADPEPLLAALSRRGSAARQEGR